MKRAFVLCDPGDTLQSIVAGWLRMRGVNECPEWRFYAKFVEGDYYSLKVPKQGEYLQVNFIAKMRPEIKCFVSEGEVPGYGSRKRAEVHRPEVGVEFYGLSEAGPYVLELVEFLLSQFGGYFLADEQLDRGIWDCVEKGYALSNNRGKVGSKVPDVLSWEELFEYLGKVVKISNFDQYAVVVKELQDRKAGRTNAFEK